MGLHYNSVNFRNLIKDLADMYTCPVPEVILTELVANSLDAKAKKIDVKYDSSEQLLIVEDNGEGMSKKQFEEYHDFAAGLKTRGSGIGFAGLGARIRWRWQKLPKKIGSIPKKHLRISLKNYWQRPGRGSLRDFKM